MTGIRRSTPATRHAGWMADGYQGLPDGVTRWRLAAALRAAAVALGLTTSMLRLIEHYIDLTYDQDWDADSEPVVTRPLVEIAEHLGLSERQIRNIERALVEKGLLAWRDSGNHHRKGRRDRRTGRLVYAYGPSLAPLGARATEIIAAAQSARADVTEARRLRIALSALRRRIRAGMAAAAETEIDVADLAARLDRTPQRDPAGLSPSVLAVRRDALLALVADIEARLGPVPDDAEDIEIAGLPETNSHQYTDTCKNPAASGKSIAEEKARALGGKAHRHGMDAAPLAVALAAAGPEMRAALAARGTPTWGELANAAREVAASLGVDDALWGEACGALGRYGAATAMVLLERGMTRSGRDGVAAIRRPAAYLRGMIARGRDSELHLDRSLRAWAQRGQSPGDDAGRRDHGP